MKETTGSADKETNYERPDDISLLSAASASVAPWCSPNTASSEKASYIHDTTFQPIVNWAWVQTSPTTSARNSYVDYAKLRLDYSAKLRLDLLSRGSEERSPQAGTVSSADGTSAFLAGGLSCCRQSDDHNLPRGHGSTGSSRDDSRSNRAAKSALVTIQLFVLTVASAVNGGNRPQTPPPDNAFPETMLGHGRSRGRPLSTYQPRLLRCQ